MMLRRPLQFPTVVVGRADVGIGLGSVLCEHCRAVPFDLLANPNGQVPKENCLRQQTRVTKVGQGGWSSLGRFQPFPFMAGIEATVSRQCLGRTFVTFKVLLGEQYVLETVVA